MDKPEQTSPEKTLHTNRGIEASTDGKTILNGNLQTNTKIPAVATISSILVYFLLFTFIYNSYGQAMAISATIPIITVGWYYGLVPGVVAGLLSYPVNILMYILFGAGWLEGMVLSGGGIPGTLALILIGAIIGRIRDLSRQLKKHHDKLDELVTLKTEELQVSNKTLSETKDY